MMMAFDGGDGIPVDMPTDTANSSSGRRDLALAHEHQTRSIIAAFFAVYNELGYGFLETVYRAAMIVELRNRGHTVDTEVSVRVYYHGQPIAWHRIDIIVDKSIVLELKATERLPPETRRQTLNYLRATNLEVALILHFGPKPMIARLASPNTPSKLDPS
jgi:GxxExxY protein